MKKAFRILTMVCLVATMTMMTSCQKQEDLIVGSWKMSEIKCTPENPLLVLFMNNITFTFNADNTFSMTTVVFDETDTQNGTYSIADDKLTLIVEGDPMVCDVLTLDKKTLEFVMTETDEDQTFSIDMKFNRQ